MCVQVLYYIKNLFSYFMNKKCKLFLPVHTGGLFQCHTHPRASPILLSITLNPTQPIWKLVEKESFAQNN